MLDRDFSSSLTFTYLSTVLDIQNPTLNNQYLSDHGHGHSHGGVPPPSNVRHLTEIVNSNADMALGHNAIDTEETDEMMVPPKSDKTPNNNKQPCRSGSDPGHMNMKGVFLHVLSDALGKLLLLNLTKRLIGKRS